ncbi:MAG: hypothetical protein AB1391_02275 [Candidatus Micrarchaeota archaeon]
MSIEPSQKYALKEEERKEQEERINFNTEPELSGRMSSIEDRLKEVAKNLRMDSISAHIAEINSYLLGMYNAGKFLNKIEELNASLKEGKMTESEWDKRVNVQIDAIIASSKEPACIRALRDFVNFVSSIFSSKKLLENSRATHDKNAQNSGGIKRIIKNVPILPKKKA